ncbi:MAG TPA: hypothetical protein PKK31_05915 [Elusimicrobiales bacterium]|nr:hypothetical protein [Elusimicrobiales bacterium]
MLRGPDCALLQKQAAALSDWRVRLGEPAGRPGLCGCRAGACELRLEDAAPDFVALRHGTRAGRWGPNCWNAALVASGILAAPRFTSPEEMTFWMASPYCRALGAGETPLPGDIIAVRDRDGAEVHGFIHLTEELSFSKNYLTAAAPYELQSPEAVYAEFPVPQACRPPGRAPAACPARSEYFRCSRPGRQDLPDEPVYAATEAAVSRAESELSGLALRWKTDPELKARAAEILDSAKQILAPARAEAEARAEFRWRALLLRIDSLLHQVSLI